jgi:hypothetical protein
MRIDPLGRCKVVNAFAVGHGWIGGDWGVGNSSLYYYPGNMKVSSIYPHGSYQAEPARYLPCLDSRPGSQGERPAVYHLVRSAVVVHADTFSKATCLSQANNKPTAHPKLLSFDLARFPGPLSTFYLALLVLISAFEGKRKISDFGIPVADFLSSSSAFRFRLPKLYIVWHRRSPWWEDRDYTQVTRRWQDYNIYLGCMLVGYNLAIINQYNDISSSIHQSSPSISYPAELASLSCTVPPKYVSSSVSIGVLVVPARRNDVLQSNPNHLGHFARCNLGLFPCTPRHECMYTTSAKCIGVIVLSRCYVGSAHKLPDCILLPSDLHFRKRFRSSTHIQQFA